MSTGRQAVPDIDSKTRTKYVELAEQLIAKHDLRVGDFYSGRQLEVSGSAAAKIFAAVQELTADEMFELAYTADSPDYRDIQEMLRALGVNISHSTAFTLMYQVPAAALALLMASRVK